MTAKRVFITFYFGFRYQGVYFSAIHLGVEKNKIKCNRKMVRGHFLHFSGSLVLWRKSLFCYFSNIILYFEHNVILKCGSWTSLFSKNGPRGHFFTPKTLFLGHFWHLGTAEDIGVHFVKFSDFYVKLSVLGVHLVNFSDFT